MAISKIIGACVADDAIDVSDLGTIMSVGETAPSSPFVGQRWYKASTAITYQYTNDGSSSFWLDISSGGIGTSLGRSVDIVADTDPHLETNPAGGIGSVYYNREANRHFVCTDATTNANVWFGRYAGLGGEEDIIKVSSSFYRVHKFLRSGFFMMDSTINCEFLVIGGGGSGASLFGGNNNSGGGGGAGGMITNVGTGSAVSFTGGAVYNVTVATGGHGGEDDAGESKGDDGENSQIAGAGITTIIGYGGGGGGKDSLGRAGGSAGGSGHGQTGTPTAATQTSHGNGTGYGYAGGTAVSGGNRTSGGGGGAGAVGGNAGSTSGNGGAGRANTITGTSVTYAGGGAGGGCKGQNTGGGTGGTGGGGDGGKFGPGLDAIDGTGSGGGASGSTNSENLSTPGRGGSGIVVIRYLIA